VLFFFFVEVAYRLFFRGTTTIIPHFLFFLIHDPASSRLMPLLRLNLLEKLLKMVIMKRLCNYEGRYSITL
jgi:hypothetical protein